MYEMATTACREAGMASGCYLWEGVRWYLYFTGSQQGADAYMHGTGMAAGEQGRYRAAVAREWSGYAYGKGWIISERNLNFWSDPQRPSPEMAQFISMSFAGPAVADISSDLCWQPRYSAADLGEDIYPNPGLPEQYTLRRFGTYQELVSAGHCDSHHIIQDAAVRDVPGYNRNDAPAVQLKGPAFVRGGQPTTPHSRATYAQRIGGHGTYGAERETAKFALRAAGFSEHEINIAIEMADDYFINVLGLKPDSPLRVPGTP
jgi:hypothetical protein